ncbi:carboxymuconolactone decarboxylase family protein [Pseudorhodoferax sp.]|uniref:carboxymuconolactone decarboxylase family protein n=1 Tax=Pseudorhodoferax sp. TaxID=1993553 RepID=UPI0039E68EE0
MPRIQMPAQDELTAEQKQAIAEVVAGPRGKVPEPMIAWLRNPEMARRIQMLGQVLRFETSIENHWLEMAIIMVGRHWTSHLEWTAHKKYALAAGLDPQVVADIAARRVPGIADARGRAVYDVAAQMLRTGRLPEELYRRAVGLLGERGLAELVSVLGYYCLACFTLNAFELGLPAHVAPELEDPDHPRQA